MLAGVRPYVIAWAGRPARKPPTTVGSNSEASERELQKSTGVEKVHAVVGGWHLAPYPDDIIDKTVGALKEIDPDYLIPMHCTGFRTMMAVQREMPQKLIMPSTGTSVVFGA